MDLQDAKDSILRYVHHGIPTGDFLRAVLENDLMMALGRADITSRANLFDICEFIYNEIPSSSHGSPEKVKEWAAKARAFSEMNRASTEVKTAGR